MVWLMADNSRSLYRGVAAYLSQQLGLRVALVEDLARHERLLDCGQADMGLICGLLYTH